MKERIRRLLASGLKASEVASIVGCTPAYVSQLLKDTEFHKLVEADMLEAQEKNDEEVHLDTRYHNTEHRILTYIEKELPNAELPQLVRALEAVGKRQSERRKEKHPVAPAAVPGVNIYVTQLALPAHAIAAPAPVVSVNEKNEIIAIDAKPLAPMSADGVKNIFQQMQVQKRVGALLDQKTQDAKILQEI